MEKKDRGLLKCSEVEKYVKRRILFIYECNIFVIIDYNSIVNHKQPEIKYN